MASPASPASRSLPTPRCRPSPPRCHALELVRVATRTTRGPTPRTDAGFERTRERGRADPRGERAREREERLNFGGGARQAGLAGLAGDARDARGYPYDRKKVHHGCLRRMCPQYCPKFSLLLLLLLQEAVEPSPVARRTTGVQAEARRSGEAGEADRGQLRAEPRLVRNHPPTAAARGSSSLCCCVLLQGQWRRPRCRPSQRGEDEVKLAVRHDPDRDQVRRGPTQVRGWQWLRWEMSLCGPLRPALKA